MPTTTSIIMPAIIIIITMPTTIIIIYLHKRCTKHTLKNTTNLFSVLGIFHSWIDAEDISNLQPA